MKIKHLEDINMGYFEHLIQAWRMGIILLVHGVFPFLWETKVSDEILDYQNNIELP